MAIDFDAIRRTNIEDWGRRIADLGQLVLSGLYSDRTHFIFELIQNAEDAEASIVHFRLYQDRLEFEHNGRPFNEADVWGICGLVDSTKVDDRTKIGKFGIGFKSVYAHTSSPEIHSGDAHFAIDNYVQPRSICARPNELGTLFVFAFHCAEKTREESYQAISQRLQALEAETLLFLSNIDEISYCIASDDSGTISRNTSTDVSCGIASIVELREERIRDNRNQSWLVFTRDVHHLVEAERKIPEGGKLAVQIAFECKAESVSELPEIRKLTSSPLYVFFPTEKEMHLGFLVQGPFVTTPSRDNIRKGKEVPFNASLADEIGKLVVEALIWFRDRNWLTVNVLNTLPLEYEGFHDIESYTFVESLFTPVYDRVLTAMKEKALIPAYGGRYVSGQQSIIEGSEALRNLLDIEQLQQILDTDEETHWVMTTDLTQELRRYLLDEVEIEELDADKFVRRLDSDFLLRQSDDWIRRFYEYASVFNSRSYSHTSPFNILKQKPIVRLEDGSQVAPYKNQWDDKPKAYLPTGHESQFPTVKREVCKSDKSLEFLKKLGLKEPDIVDEVLTLILPKYKDGQEIDEAEHLEHIELIVRALDVDSQVRKGELVRELNATCFLRATNAIGESDIRKPDDILYFRNPTLEMYFKGNPDAWFISLEYEQYFDDLEQLGVFHGVAYWLQTPSPTDGHVTIRSKRGNHRRGLNGFDPNYRIDGLEFALSHKSVERSAYIWNRLLIPRKHSVIGDVEISSVQTYPSDHRTDKEEEVSIAGKLVRGKPWLPDGNGEFVKPSTLSLEELPDDFHKDADLANALGMDTSRFNIDDAPDDIKAIVAAAQGRSPEELKEALDLFDEKKQKEREIVETMDPGEYRPELENRFSLPDHPSSPVPRPDPPDLQDITPDERLDIDIESEPDSEERYELRIRRTWQPRNPETRKFLEEKYEGRCQICDYTFEQRNRTYYFEAVHLISRTTGQWADDWRNAICLCANHSAQFQHGKLDTPASNIIEQITSPQEGQENSIFVTLCGEPQLISFCTKHMAELKALIENR